MSNYITDKIEKLQKDKKYQNRLFQGKKKKKKSGKTCKKYSD